MTIAADYFVYDPEGDISWYATADEARSRCEAILEEERDGMDDSGWREDLTNLCWGRVMGRCEMTKCEPAPGDSEFDEYQDYAVRGVPW